MRFTPPTPHERTTAIGPTGELPQSLRRALELGDAFEPIAVPGPNDWLADHPEPGQTFEQFVHARPNRPDEQRGKLYLLPLGAFVRGASPSLESLQGFARAFFAMPVEVLPVMDLTDTRITKRKNPHTGNMQLLTGDILELLKRRLPNDAFALLGITMEDLYPDPAWNFVFGQASLRERVGVYSFARYDPRFFDERAAEDRQKLMLRRSCKVLAHESAHMFGIQHCIYFHCLMNGSNHLSESDARPLHLCPVDLRKLQGSIGFDVLERYRRLHDFCREMGFDDEARWLSERITDLQKQ
jgi:archaemetzincin